MLRILFSKENLPSPRASPPPTLWLIEALSMILVDKWGESLFSSETRGENHFLLWEYFYVSIAKITAFHVTKEDCSPVCDSIFSCCCCCCFKNHMEKKKSHGKLLPKSLPSWGFCRIKGSSMVMRNYTGKYLYFIKIRLQTGSMILHVLNHINIMWHLILITASI